MLSVCPVEVQRLVKSKGCPKNGGVSFLTGNTTMMTYLAAQCSPSPSSGPVLYVPLETPHAMPRWRNDASMTASCVLTILWAFIRSWHKLFHLIWIFSARRMQPTNTETALTINKNNMRCGWSDDSVTASATKHYCGWTSKQDLNCDARQLSWGKGWCQTE